MNVVNLEKSGKSSSKAEALIFFPLVSKILLKRSVLKETNCPPREQLCNRYCSNKHTLQAVLRRIEKENQRVLEEKCRLVEEKRLIRDQVNRSNYHSYHLMCGGHANLKNLVASNATAR